MHAVAMPIFNWINLNFMRLTMWMNNFALAICNQYNIRHNQPFSFSLSIESKCSLIILICPENYAENARKVHGFTGEQRKKKIVRRSVYSSNVQNVWHQTNSRLSENCRNNFVVSCVMPLILNEKTYPMRISAMAHRHMDATTK